jgi:hypothetical protein
LANGYHQPNAWTTKNPQGTPEEPFFVMSSPRNVTVLESDAAFLSCKVQDLGNKTVSWIRVRDLHILTIGRYTFTGDQRFQSLYDKVTQEWTLHIKRTQKKDSGLYECQVSTMPIKSLAFNLNVLGK